MCVFGGLGRPRYVDLVSLTEGLYAMNEEPAGLDHTHVVCNSRSLNSNIVDQQAHPFKRLKKINSLK